VFSIGRVVDAWRQLVLETVCILGCNLCREMSLSQGAYFIYWFIYCVCQVNGIPDYEDAKHSVDIYQR